MSQACTAWRGEVGAYIVGALDARAGAAVRRHLRTCRACRDDYRDLLPVRGWLARLTPADGSGAGRLPGGPPPRPPWPARRLPYPRWLRAAAAVGAAAAVTVAGFVLARPESRAFQAADRVTGVHGSARLQATPTGTQVSLLVVGLAARERCVLVAVSPGGTDIAASWTAGYDGTARITGMTAIPVSDLTELRVEAGSGEPGRAGAAARRLLLSIEVTPPGDRSP